MPETKRPGAVGAAPRPKGNDLADQPFITAPPVTTQAAAKSWRDVLPVHPAANLFPLLDPAALKELGEDIIKQKGLASPIVIAKTKATNGGWHEQLLDGRNRLDAMELVGVPLTVKDVKDCAVYIDTEQIDPYAFVISANIHRRHLTAEQKRDLIAKLLKATPEKSDRQIADVVKASPTTVGKIRGEMEPTVQSGQLKRVGKDGKARKQPKPRNLEEERARREERKRLRRGGMPSLEEIQAMDDAALDEMCAEASAEARKREYAEDEDGPADEVNPIVTAWDAASDAQRQEFVKLRRVDIAEITIIAAAAPPPSPPTESDALDDGILPFLRRTAP
jgi:hypothetical protein